jgi:hypothetical protein
MHKMIGSNKKWNVRDEAAIETMNLTSKKKEILRRLVSGEHYLPDTPWLGRRVFESILKGESAKDILWAMVYCRKCPPPWDYEPVNSEWAQMQRQLQPTDWYWPKETYVEEDPALIAFVTSAGR